ncbi:MAG: hypothetical protein IJY81_01670 [Lachnospiraceae bacterium]|nr:hypothetical protein [Lachnospiraceae bacterium]
MQKNIAAQEKAWGLMDIYAATSNFLEEPWIWNGERIFVGTPMDEDMVYVLYNCDKLEILLQTLQHL